LALFQELGDKQGIAFSLFWQAFGVMERGQYAQVRQMLEKAMTLHREVGNSEYVAWSLYRLAQPAYHEGEYERARALCEESLTLHRKLGNMWGIAYGVHQLARVLFYSRSDPALVRSLLQEALTLNRALGDKRNMAYALLLLGEQALSQANIALARSLVEESMALCREMGLAWTTFFVWSHDLLTKVEALQGDYATARSHYEEALPRASKVDDKELILACLEGLADVVAAQGEPAWAARLWGAAEALRESIGFPIPPVYRPPYERSVTAARAQLGEKPFTVAWAQGRTMSVEQVLSAPVPTTKPMPTSAEPTSAPLARKPAPYPDGLTAREVEVLRCVASGLTDAQVAAQLVISPGTVNTHLKAIYGKIGVSSRSGPHAMLLNAS
jgi:ATP/maltotriose-dependent transcriptional regulator MalT